MTDHSIAAFQRYSIKKLFRFNPTLFIFQTRISATGCLHLIVTETVGEIDPESTAIPATAGFHVQSPELTDRAPTIGAEHIADRNLQVGFAVQDLFLYADIYVCTVQSVSP